MPRGFSDSQIQTFQKKLIAAAFAALKNTGVRKTTVQDLAKAAGLSVGRFLQILSLERSPILRSLRNYRRTVKRSILVFATGRARGFSPGGLRHPQTNLLLRNDGCTFAPDAKRRVGLHAAQHRSRNY